MNESLFVTWLATNMPAVVAGVIARLNDTTNPNAPTYLHRTLLREVNSVTGRWEAISTYATQVMADVVAMDSPLPLKKRDSISKATGDIIKLGMKMSLNERQMSDLDVLVATNADVSDILAVLFNDLPKVINGIYERLEEMFLQELSSGQTVIDNPENVGTGVRLDVGYPTANKFGVGVLWSDATNAKPFSDIQRLLTKAGIDGNTPAVCRMDQATFNLLAATKDAKDLFAFSQGFVGGSIPLPSLAQVNTLTTTRYNFTIEIMNRTMRYERDGAQTTVRPWQAGSVIFSAAGRLGILAYTRLAEMNRPVAGVTYQTVESKILVSKYSTNQPSLKEFTASQARVMPVITDVTRIYQLDTTAIQA